MTLTLAPVEIGSATAEDAADAGDPGEQRVALQWTRLPRRWRRGDRAIVRTTEVALFAIGVLFTLMINVLKVFDLVFVISGTAGASGKQANVLATELYSDYGNQQYGLASAIGVFLVLLVLPAMAFNIRRFRRENR